MPLGTWPKCVWVCGAVGGMCHAPFHMQVGRDYGTLLHEAWKLLTHSPVIIVDVTVPFQPLLHSILVTLILSVNWRKIKTSTGIKLIRKFLPSVDESLLGVLQNQLENILDLLFSWKFFIVVSVFQLIKLAQFLSLCW